MSSVDLIAYQKFLEDKVSISKDAGIACSLDDIHPLLKPHQAAIVQWAVQGGRRAIFANFGLGKALASNTNVVTPTGLRPISTLVPGDFVIGAHGMFAPTANDCGTARCMTCCSMIREMMGSWVTVIPPASLSGRSDSHNANRKE